MLAIIDYRMGNIFSVFNALKRVCNAPPRILTVSEGSGGGEGQRICRQHLRVRL
nr:hypothetical protein [Methanophagales archaeon]